MDGRENHGNMVLASRALFRALLPIFVGKTVRVRKGLGDLIGTWVSDIIDFPSPSSLFSKFFLRRTISVCFNDDYFLSHTHTHTLPLSFHVWLL